MPALGGCSIGWGVASWPERPGVGFGVERGGGLGVGGDLKLQGCCVPPMAPSASTLLRSLSPGPRVGWGRVLP